MSVQAALNADSMNSIPKVKQVISKAENFEANQMEQKALNKMMNSHVAIVDMNCQQLEQFQDDLIEIFKFNNWLS